MCLVPQCLTGASLSRNIAPKEAAHECCSGGDHACGDACACKAHAEKEPLRIDGKTEPKAAVTVPVRKKNL